MKTEIGIVEISADVQNDGTFYFSVEDWFAMSFVHFNASKDEIRILRDKLNELLNEE